MKYIVNIGVHERLSSYLDKYVNNPDYWIYGVEAHPKIYERLLRDYEGKVQNVTFSHCAICTRNEEVVLFSDMVNHPLGPGSFCSHNSLSYDYLIKQNHQEENIQAFRVPGRTLKSYLEVIGLADKEIELLCMDCESLDADILLATDFSGFQIKQIAFEPVMMGDELYEKVLAHMRQFGYNKVSVWETTDRLLEKSSDL